MYHRKGDGWAEGQAEVVNFKTGGVLKTIGTAGIVKGDVNGHINGLHSPNQVKTPLEFLIYTTEGVGITVTIRLVPSKSHKASGPRAESGAAQMVQEWRVQ